MLAILNVAIGLSFIFLLFSLFVTSLNEIVLSLFDQRAEFLRNGLFQVLGNHEETLEKFISHGLIDSYSRTVNGKPAYLPPEAFVAALLDLISPVKIDSANPAAVRTLKDVALALNDTAHPLLATNDKLKTTLKVLYDKAGGDLAALKEGLENWFDEGMDRVSGWYKRRAQNVLFVLSFAGAVFCNVDSIHIIQGLSSDPKLRDDVVGIATQSANSPGADLATIISNVKDSLAQLNTVALPIGWNDAQLNYLFNDIRLVNNRLIHKTETSQSSTPAPTIPPATNTPSLTTSPSSSTEALFERGLNWGHIVSALVGWFVTALAASLGAPFWFQTLTRFINIRGNGLKPEDAQKLRADAAAKIAADTTATAVSNVVAAATTI